MKVINKKEIRYLKTYVDDDCRKPRIVFRNEEDARTWARTLHPQKYKHEGKEMTTLTSLRAELKALKRIRDTSSDFAGGFLDVVQDGNYIYMAMVSPYSRLSFAVFLCLSLAILRADLSSRNKRRLALD